MLFSADLISHNSQVLVQVQEGIPAGTGKEKKILILYYLKPVHVVHVLH